jgi:hypothetical protein
VEEAAKQATTATTRSRFYQNPTAFHQGGSIGGRPKGVDEMLPIGTNLISSWFIHTSKDSKRQQ